MIVVNNSDMVQYEPSHYHDIYLNKVKEVETHIARYDSYVRAISTIENIEETYRQTNDDNLAKQQLDNVCTSIGIEYEAATASFLGVTTSFIKTIFEGLIDIIKTVIGLLRDIVDAVIEFIRSLFSSKGKSNKSTGSSSSKSPREKRVDEYREELEKKKNELYRDPKLLSNMMARVDEYIKQSEASIKERVSKLPGILVVGNPDNIISLNKVTTLMETIDLSLHRLDKVITKDEFFSSLSISKKSSNGIYIKFYNLLPSINKLIDNNKILYSKKLEEDKLSILDVRNNIYELFKDSDNRLSTIDEISNRGKYLIKRYKQNNANKGIDNVDPVIYDKLMTKMLETQYYKSFTYKVFGISGSKVYGLLNNDVSQDLDTVKDYMIKYLDYIDLAKKLIKDNRLNDFTVDMVKKLKPDVYKQLVVVIEEVNKNLHLAFINYISVLSEFTKLRPMEPFKYGLTELFVDDYIKYVNVDSNLVGVDTIFIDKKLSTMEITLNKVIPSLEKYKKDLTKSLKELDKYVKDTKKTLEDIDRDSKKLAKNDSVRLKSDKLLNTINTFTSTYGNTVSKLYSDTIKVYSSEIVDIGKDIKNIKYMADDFLTLNFYTTIKKHS